MGRYSEQRSQAIYNCQASGLYYAVAAAVVNFSNCRRVIAMRQIACYHRGSRQLWIACQAQHSMGIGDQPLNDGGSLAVDSLRSILTIAQLFVMRYGYRPVEAIICHSPALFIHIFPHRYLRSTRRSPHAHHVLRRVICSSEFAYAHTVPRPPRCHPLA